MSKIHRGRVPLYPHSVHSFTFFVTLALQSSNQLTESTSLCSDFESTSLWGICTQHCKDISLHETWFQRESYPETSLATKYSTEFKTWTKLPCISSEISFSLPRVSHFPPCMPCGLRGLLLLKEASFSAFHMQVR